MQAISTGHLRTSSDSKLVRQYPGITLRLSMFIPGLSPSIPSMTIFTHSVFVTLKYELIGHTQLGKSVPTGHFTVPVRFSFGIVPGADSSQTADPADPENSRSPVQGTQPFSSPKEAKPGSHLLHTLREASYSFPRPQKSQDDDPGEL